MAERSEFAQRMAGELRKIRVHRALGEQIRAALAMAVELTAAEAGAKARWAAHNEHASNATRSSTRSTRDLNHCA